MKSYQTSIPFHCLETEAFEMLTQIPKWWTTDFIGQNAKAGDEFIIHHPGAHYAKHRVLEAVPGEKLIWLVTESKLYWLKNQEEWTGTQMIFELSDGELRFTHQGLTPDKESYERCSQGWDLVIGKHLLNFITNKS